MGKDAAGRGRQPQGDFQHLAQRNEAGVAYHPIAGLIDHLRCQQPGAGLFHHRNARVLAQFPGELIGPGIDCEHMAGTFGQQNVGKAAGGAADIHRHRPRGIEQKMLDRVSQLDSPPADPRVIAASHFDGDIFVQLTARLFDLGPPRKNQTGHD